MGREGKGLQKSAKPLVESIKAVEREELIFWHVEKVLSRALELLWVNGNSWRK